MQDKENGNISSFIVSIVSYFHMRGGTSKDVWNWFFRNLSDTSASNELETAYHEQFSI